MLISFPFGGVYFIPCDCYCDVICDVQIWHPKKIQERSNKNLIIVFCIEFYDLIFNIYGHVEGNFEFL